MVINTIYNMIHIDSKGAGNRTSRPAIFPVTKYYLKFYEILWVIERLPYNRFGVSLRKNINERQSYTGNILPIYLGYRCQCQLLANCLSMSRSEILNLKTMMMPNIYLQGKLTLLN